MEDRGLRNPSSDYDKKPKKKLSKKKKAAIIVSSVLVFLIVGSIGGFYILQAVGKSSLQKNATSSIPSLIGDSISMDDAGILTYNGKKYKYNDSIVTILCMGIDTEGTVAQAKMGQAGHSDMMFLLVLDDKNKKMSMVAISRDSVTEIDTYATDGSFVESREGIVSHQYFYGDGKGMSGKLSMNTVSEMMYNLPIHGYAAIHLNAIGEINDAVGGVTVTVPEEDKDYQQVSGYKGGQTVTLYGNKAEQFVRRRNIYVEGYTNNVRMQRQKTYLMGFLSALKGQMQKDITAPVKIYQKVSPYLNTDISIDKISYLATMVTGFNFSDDNIHNIKGENSLEGEYARYTIDDDALQELIINVFYEEIAEPSSGGFVEVTTKSANVDTFSTSISIDNAQ